MHVPGRRSSQLRHEPPSSRQRSADPDFGPAPGRESQDGRQPIVAGSGHTATAPSQRRHLDQRRE